MSGKRFIREKRMNFEGFEFVENYLFVSYYVCVESGIVRRMSPT